MIPKGSTGRINRLINSAIVPKKAERYPLSTTERFVDATNDSRIGWTMIVAPIRPRLVRTTRIRKTVTKLKLIFYAFGCWKLRFRTNFVKIEDLKFIWKPPVPPLGYDGSIAYPWCPPQRVRSRRVGHSVTGMLRIPVLSNGICNVEHIFYNQTLRVPVPPTGHSNSLGISSRNLQSKFDLGSFASGTKGFKLFKQTKFVRSAPLGGTKGTKGFQALPLRPQARQKQYQ